MERYSESTGAIGREILKLCKWQCPFDLEPEVKGHIQPFNKSIFMSYEMKQYINL